MDAGAIFIGLAIMMLSILYVIGPFQKKQKEMQVVSAFEREHPGERRRKILAALRELEFDYKIGKIVQEDHAVLRSQLLSEAARLISESEAADQEIEALIERRRQSREIHTTRCPKCRRVVSADDLFCPSCGMAIARPCPECGMEAIPNARFCSRCGAHLEQD